MEGQEVASRPKLMKRKVPAKGVLRCYKIRMYPTSEQRDVLDTWMRAANWSYNQAVERLQRDHLKRGNIIALRKEITVKEKVPVHSAWVLKVASRIRNRAVQQAVDAQNINLQKWRTTGKDFKLQFRSRAKDPTRCVILEKGPKGPVKGFKIIENGSNNKQKTLFGVTVSWGTGGLGKGVDSVIKLRDKRKIAKRVIDDGPLAEDAKLLYDRRVGVYWLSVTLDVPIKQGRIDADTARVVALDPGTRVFNTYYSPDGTHGELLAGELAHLEACAKKLDLLHSRIDMERNYRDKQLLYSNNRRASHRKYCRRKRQMKRKINRISHHMRCRMANAHYDAAHVLLDSYDFLVVPKFETSKMAKKAERVVNSKVARAMYTWAHFKFRQRLASKVGMDRSKHMRIVGEPGTSKTCGHCGGWNTNLGRKKVFKCEMQGGCGVEMERDINGARNNLLAELTYVLNVTRSI
jgi:putative transposase